MPTPHKQRLALFLDGTWNTEDDSTNVLNAYHSTVEGEVQEHRKTIVQKRYYDRGVGTSMFNNIRGGSYGMGLEKNVREAYNWLVDNYNDNAATEHERGYCEKVKNMSDEDREKADEMADEIYIFGFSRGAYTARSLVGLIAACGLVKRGAPMTITQLYNGYGFISKNREKSQVWWEKELKKEKNKHYFGRLSSYEFREKGKTILHNDSEKLLNVWSRRVKITYLGIYDTVGAMGIHASGIPGLKSKLDTGHNTNPTSIINRCRHALAIDEHRPNFRLTPILDWVENRFPKQLNEYEGKIKQMWFTGAHSNIGGGYENNSLSIEPLKWIMEGAKEKDHTFLDIVDLHAKDDGVIEAELPGKQNIRDSFAELAGYIYPNIIREKRHYRPIGRFDVVRAGYSLRSIDEKIHDSVDKIPASNDGHNYSPPNLISYYKQKDRYGTEEEKKNAQVDVFKDRIPKVSWPAELMTYAQSDKSIFKTIISWALLILWCILAAYGILRIIEFSWIKPFSYDVYPLIFIACLFALVDWSEHKLLMARNFAPDAVRTEVAWNLVYWLRLLGVIAFFVGVAGIIRDLSYEEFNFNFSYSGILAYIKLLGKDIWTSKVLWSPLALLVIVFPLYLSRKVKTNTYPHKIVINTNRLVLENKPIAETNRSIKEVEPEKRKLSIKDGVIPVIFFWLTVGLTYYILANYCASTANADYVSFVPSSILLVFLLLFGLRHIFNWVGKPMGDEEAGIGSIFNLQNCLFPADVTKLFNSYVDKFYRTWSSKEDNQILKQDVQFINDKKEEIEYDPKNNNLDVIDPNKAIAWLHVRKVLRRAIWRDIIGLVPLYSVIFGIILFMGCTLFAKDSGSGIVIWIALIGGTFIFDMLENRIELAHIKNHPKNGSHGLLHGLGVVSTILKFVGFMTTAVMVVITIFKMIVINVSTPQAGIWTFSVGVTYVAIFMAFMTIVKFIIKAIRKDE